MKKNFLEDDNFNLIEISDPEILFNEVKKYIESEHSIERIKDAYYYANKKHKGQLRKSGENFIIHPLTCAYFLAQWKMNPDTIIIGLLHDVIEDTLVSKEEIEDIFGKYISDTVESVSKSNYMTKINNKEFKNQYLEKLIFNLVKDINVIVVKLADRLSNVITLQYMPPEKQKNIAQETLDVYVSIAERIGMLKVKWYLEDICFKIVDENAYNMIQDYVLNEDKINSEKIDNIINEISVGLEAASIFNADVFGRQKTIYSIFNKMKKFDKSIANIGDILAFRIITKSVEECYLALGTIHKLYTPLAGRFKDYISIPKNNFYQSLHTTVISKDGIVFEIQIRTFEMDDVAENGVATHWKYKKGEEDLTQEELKRLDAEKLSYLNNILNISGELNKYAKEFDGNSIIDANIKENISEIIKNDFLTPVIYVLNKEGDVFNFSVGSSVLDFAYHIYPEKANYTKNCRINGEDVEVFEKLKNGDIVEISFADYHTVDINWIEFLKTTDAKKSVENYFSNNKILEKNKSKLSKNELISHGIEMVKNYYEIKNNLNKFNEDKFEKHYLEFKFKSKDKFIIAIANNKISLSDIYNVFESNYDVDGDITNLEKIISNSKNVSVIGRNDILINKEVKTNCVLSDCCLPYPHDVIVGILNYDNNIYEIHREICPILLALSKKDLEDRSVKCNWLNSNISKNVYKILFAIKFIDEKYISKEITKIFYNNCFSIEEIKNKFSVDEIKLDKIRIMEAELLIENVYSQDEIKKQIKNIDGVIAINRAFNIEWFDNNTIVN